MSTGTHNMNTAYHTHIHHSHIHRTHTHKLTQTHTHTTHIHHLHTYIHINSPTIAFPSLSYFLFPCSLTHSPTHPPTHSLTQSLTHILIHSPVHAHTYTHTQKLTHHHPSITLILPLPFLLFYAQSKSREVGNMWGYPVL